MRVGLGCMRLSTDADRDEARAIATIHAALDSGVTIFDTAHAYGLDDADRGHGERLLGRALRAHPGGAAARVISKGGMCRPAGAWVPDGRAVALRSDAEASLEALGGVPIDLYLLHAPDPRVPWATSVRALAALLDAGLVRRVGVSNVSRKLLDEALALAPVAAVEVALGAFASEPWRNGVFERCAALGLTLLAHAPLGGPARAPRLARDPALVQVAARHTSGGAEVTPAQVALARLVALHPSIVALPGARRPETARAAAGAARLAERLDAADAHRLRARFPESLARTPPPPRADGGEVVLVMGLQGAGKTSGVGAWAARGYERLNRDERGGTLRGLNRALDERLAAGVRRFVLDNTYLTRTQRRDVVDVAWKHGLPVRCVWLATPVAAAQRNVIARMLAAHGRLLEPDEMKRATDPARLPPLAFLRAVRELEPPADDEGFASIDVVRFERRADAGADAAPGARFLAYEALSNLPSPPPLERPEATLVFTWRPGANRAVLAAIAASLPPGVAFAACVHPAGPPTCWCRPPLPGLLLAFAHERGLAVERSVVVGSTPAHRALAEAVAARYEPV
jgi:aryl-alcohol dehydrogenase-like predicted oxidoreductase